jgi:catechol 2,3-dioxygenase-like lactoylglutathione lyase family enzyme
LYIRKPDPYRHHVGDVDFYLPPEEYTRLKQEMQAGRVVPGARIFDRPDLDMIELYDPDVDALGYVSMKTMTEKVRVKIAIPQDSGMAKGITFAGVRTRALEPMRSFLGNVLGLELKHDQPGFLAFRAPNDDRFEVFAPDFPNHEHFTTGPVVGFEVEDIEAAVERLKGSGIKFLSPICGTPDRTQWAHFEGPDGNVYEVVKHLPRGT